MDADFAGRVRNTKLAVRHALMPLFEAIVNSIQATTARHNPRVIVKILRVPTPEHVEVHGNTVADIEGFEVEDNGVGFTTQNFEAFNTSDTQNKAQLGGKGVGRIFWLVAFERARIFSVFPEDGRWHRRQFDFLRTKKGVENALYEAVEGHSEQKTTVRLEAFKSRYARETPKSADAIARRIVEHCLEYFLLNMAPPMSLVDDADGNRIDLNALFADDFRPETSTTTVTVAEQPFQVQHVLIRRPVVDAFHQIKFCADNRLVQSVPIAGRLSHLEDSIKSESGEAQIYAAYVSAPLLNQTVDSDRTGFDIDRRSELALNQTGLVWEDIVDAVIGVVEAFLKPHLDAARERAAKRIRSFVDDKEPRYRPVLKHRATQVAKIPGNISDEKLDVELYRILHGWREEVRGEVKKQLAPVDDSTDLKKHKAALETVLEEMQEVVKADLVEYVLHRAAVLSFFEKLLGIQASGKFALEEELHRTIFPMRTTSDDVTFDDHNLWILDERLAYHRYLASDLNLDAQDGAPIQVESQDRPDIVIYNRPFAFTPDAQDSSIVIVEFKRPERNDYQADDTKKNPLRQLLDYVHKLRNGKATRDDGSVIEPPAENTRFFCYLVVTLTQKVRDEAIERSFTEMPRGGGYFHYNPNLKTYTEIISYRRLLEEAKQRNKAFFDRLELPIR